MNPIKCTWWVLDLSCESRSLRRYASSYKDPENVCEHSGMGYHNAHFYLPEAPPEFKDDPKFGKLHCSASNHRKEFEDNDPRWPTHCACGYAFKETDERQLFAKLHYKNEETGQSLSIDDLPVGAMFSAWHYENDNSRMCGPDGKSIHVKLPDDYVWCVDARASNCTMPKDNIHKCWIRHGSHFPWITVDKAGNTCNAGAGSILTKKWHGYLEKGYLVLERHQAPPLPPGIII